MNNQLTENEKRVMNILNYKDDLNDIWMPIQELVDKIQMDINELEMALYLLQMRRLVRISMDEMGALKLTTEEKVAKKIGARVSSALGDMEEAREDAVEEENYEEAAKLRDWVLMAKDPERQDELIKALLEDIDNEED
jgi:cysteinyl-tRNA synthetase